MRSIAELERHWATSERRFAETLQRVDDSWGTVVAEVADGIAVLSGPGLYVNELRGAGLSRDVEPCELDAFEAQASAVGVDPAVAVTEATRRSVVDLLTGRGYRPDDQIVVAFVHDLAPVPMSTRMFDVVPAELAAWQHAARQGWGHEGDATVASDLYAAVGAEVDDPGLLLALDVDDGRVVGSATLKIEGDVATLGAMSTIPSDRGRGVQTALIAHRLHVARQRGCVMAASSALEGGGSARNLERAGFRISHTKTTWRRSP